jgi:hypothetical protein
MKRGKFGVVSGCKHNQVIISEAFFLMYFCIVNTRKMVLTLLFKRLVECH